MVCSLDQGCGLSPRSAWPRRSECSDLATRERIGAGALGVRFWRRLRLRKRRRRTCPTRGLRESRLVAFENCEVAFLATGARSGLPADQGAHLVLIVRVRPSAGGGEGVERPLDRGPS